MSSLDNALRILSLLGPERPVLKVGEVSRVLALPKASVSRLLNTLGESGFLERGPDGLGYVVGPRSLVLGELYLAQHSLLDMMEQVSNKLIGEFGFVSYISKLEKDGLFILRRKDGSYPLRLIRDVGQHAPAFQTASGRAMLAHLPEIEALGVVSTDPVWRKRSREVRTILAEIREIGVSVTVSTGTPGVAAIAAAVRHKAQAEMFAFSISYPMVAADGPMRVRMAMRVREEAFSLGHSFADEFWLKRGAAMPDSRLTARLTGTPVGSSTAPVGAE